MRKQDVTKLHNETVEVLEKKLVELRKSLFTAYNGRISGKEKNVHVINDAKKDIARVLSVLRQKELGL